MRKRDSTAQIVKDAFRLSFYVFCVGYGIHYWFLAAAELTEYLWVTFAHGL